MDQGRSRQLTSAPAMPGFAEAYRTANIQFSDPWGNAASVAAANPTSAPFVGLTSTSLAPPADMLTKSYRQNNSYSMPASTFAATYAQAPVTASPTAGATNYGMNDYGYDQASNRSLQSSLVDYGRTSMPSSYVSPDAMEASRGMMTLAHNGAARQYSVPTSQHRNSSSASSSFYPPSVGSVSGASSISSVSSYPGYYGSIGDSSATDMSSIAGTDYDLGRPSLPRPSGMVQSHHFPHQAGMMTTFNSRVQSNTQKKHRCKVCDKRFTRPSSLQTHMYSHTGEKPFTCDVAECGRAFSVVSNLRRHRKVHKNLDMDSPHSAGSP